MPKVYNVKYGMIPGAIYIGRGTRYGNPYVIGHDGTREEVCNKFECFVLPTLDVSGLAGKDLICHCKPDRCHGDAILEKANSLGSAG